jgi:hypothetical protein
MIEPIDSATFEAGHLMREHPPRWHHANKQLVYEIACGSGRPPSGTIVYSRWCPMPLASAAAPADAALRVEGRQDVYDYVPAGRSPGAVEWHVNFADPILFVAYGSRLFAQDEMQVAEHPALGALKEALDARGRPALTVERGAPTPILVTAVQRRCRIATDPNAAEGRPYGLYGNAFATADAESIRRATTRIDPPTISNIIAIAAPSGAVGRYTAQQVRPGPTRVPHVRLGRRAVARRPRWPRCGRSPTKGRYRVPSRRPSSA